MFLAGMSFWWCIFSCNKTTIFSWLYKCSFMPLGTVLLSNFDVMFSEGHYYEEQSHANFQRSQMQRLGEPRD